MLVASALMPQRKRRSLWTASSGSEPGVWPMDLVAEAGLVISGEQVQRDGEHFTRYVELAREAPAVPEDAACKTSVILTLADRAGALDEVLQSFSRQGVNLTRIESRPVPGTPPRFRFFVDM